MTCWVVIPVKGPDHGKRRLAGVLDDEQRRGLIRGMLGKVIAAAETATTTDRVVILGSTTFGHALPLLDAVVSGLNPSLHFALEEAHKALINRVVFVSGDLPQIIARDIELLSLAPADTVAIAPDRHGTGTNALSLPLPAARGFGFAFGPGSFALHTADSRRLGLEIEVIESPGLMRDIDLPADLPDAGDLLGD